MIQLDWATFKTYVNVNGINMRELETSTQYIVYAIDDGFTTYTALDKSPSDTTDRDDYTTNFRGKFAAQYSIPFEFKTSRLATGNTNASDDFYSKDIAGTDRSYITLKVYDGSNAEITTPGLLNANLNQAVKTVIDFEPTYDYQIVGGDVRCATAISSDVRLYLIALPDIPAGSGGSKELGGGINLKYLSTTGVMSLDAAVRRFVTYNATFHTNKLRLVLKYPAGTNEELQVVTKLRKL